MKVIQRFVPNGSISVKQPRAVRDPQHTMQCLVSLPPSQAYHQYLPPYRRHVPARLVEPTKANQPFSSLHESVFQVHELSKNNCSKLYMQWPWDRGGG